MSIHALLITILQHVDSNVYGCVLFDYIQECSHCSTPVLSFSTLDRAPTY